MDFHDPLTTYDPVCLKAIEAKDLAESIIRVIDTTPVPQADGDSGDSPSEGGLLKSGMFEHLPEWP